MRVKIDGHELTDFIVNDITFNYDAVSDTFSLTAPFYQNWPQSRSRFRPLSYPTVEIFDNSRRKLLTGRLVNHVFKENAESNQISITGYSKTGVLDDCPDTANSVVDGDVNDSTTYQGLTLRQLAESLVKPFGIEVEVDELVSKKMDEEVYEQTTTDKNESIAGRLAKMATLKNIVMRCTAEGRLRFTQVDPNLKPVAKFSTGDGVVNEIGLLVNGQAMHSIFNIEGAMEVFEDEGEDQEKVGEVVQISNPLVKAFRPTVVKQGTENKSVEEVSKAVLADELKNITLTIECKGWKVIDDSVLLPGDLVSVKAPGVFLYRWTTWLVRSVRLKEDAKTKQSTLICVLPQTMTGETPELIFEEHGSSASK